MIDRTQVRWADVWTRAVILPAWRRAGAVWVGCAIVGSVVFGPTAMSPGTLTGLALHHPGIGAVLAATWVLVFAPTARLIVRAEGAAYLRSLPAPALAPLAIGGGALIALQLPWLALWVIGEGVAGLAVVAATTAAVVALARWRPPRARAGWPAWAHGAAALRGVQLRALRRRAGDALVRGAGLAVLAGAAAGLFVRHNQLTGADAAGISASVVAVGLVPAHVGALLVILGAHRESAWLAATLGLSRGARIGAVVYAIGAIQLAASALALAAIAVVSGAGAPTLGWIAGTTLAVAAGSTLCCARVLLGAEDAPSVAARTVVGSIAIAALVVLCLGLFGVPGVAAIAATGCLALLAVPG
ncbi:MAG: hypothetical protein ACTHU0_18765 [Kofleriaceae bacterium]